MDRIEAMVALLEVVKAGSFSGAARTLGVPVTSLARKVSELETRLNARLLVRSTRSLSLTDAGADYVEAARRIIEQVDEAERALTGEYLEPRGDLVITAPTAFGRIHVVPVVADFLALYPNIDVRLLLTDANLHFVDDRVDIAVRIGDLADSTLIATRVGDMRTVVCASPEYLAAVRRPDAPTDLRGLRCVTVGSLQRPTWRFTTPGSGRLTAVTITPRLSVTTTDAAVEAAIRGVGMAQLRFYQVADAVASGGLRMVLEAYEPARLPIHVLHTSRDHVPVKARRFLEFVTPALRARVTRV